MINKVMNFNKLCEVILEAKGTRPGQTYKTAKETAAPMGFSRTSAGFGGTQEKKTPLDRWEWSNEVTADPETNGKSGDGFRAMKRIYKVLNNAFRLLENDIDFNKRIVAMSNDMDKKRESYGKITLQDENGKDKIYDEENVMKIFPGNIAKYAGEEETRRAKIAYLETVKKNTERPTEIAAIDKELNKIEAERQEYENKLNTAQDIYNQVLERTSEIEETNKMLNDQKMEAFRYYLKSTAEQLLLDNEQKLASENQFQDLSQLNWEDTPKGMQEKMNMLRALASEDPTINPILAYLDIYDTRYSQREAELRDQELNANVNITKVRDYNSLPFVQLVNLYNNMKYNEKFGFKPHKLAPVAMDSDEKSDSAYLELKKILDSINNEETWTTKIIKNRKYIEDLVDMLALTDSQKQNIKGYTRTMWSNATGRTKINTAQLMLQELNKYRKQLSESHISSFDSFVSSILESMEFDHDDYEIDIIELLEKKSAKCTGTTKKASSTRPGKKYMQCVKNPDGSGYKRVHFGQKGVKVTGKSGNTKRKKSFRSRHKCSTAKPGTARYLSCKNW